MILKPGRFATVGLLPKIGTGGWGVMRFAGSQMNTEEKTKAGVLLLGGLQATQI